jgi:dynein heavy chain, axonemal
MNTSKSSMNVLEKTMNSDAGSRGPNKLKEMIQKQSQSDVNKLDHNNIPVVFVNRRAAAVFSSTKKSKTQPGLRSFPGEVTLVRKGCPSGAVYAEDLEKEDRESKENMSFLDFQPQELIRQHDFLKIDQSKLPLEIFDNIDVEEKDKSPAMWLASKSGGKSPYFHNNAWVWRPVEVNGFDEVTREYLVKFLPDGIEKKVRRLNLQFDDEDAAVFTERKRVAEVAREDAKQIMRLDHFVNQQPKESVVSISQESIRHIHEKVVDGLPSSVPFPEQGSVLGSVLRTLTGDLIIWYTRAMKRTVLMAKLEGYYKDEDVVLRYSQLNLPPIPKKTPAPQNGKVPCPEYPFIERALRIENYHYSSQKEVLSVFKWLHDRWTQKFQYYCFIDGCQSGVELPCTIKVFRQVQSDKNLNTLKLIEKDFRRAFLDQLMDCVQDVYDFFQSSYNAYRTGPLYKLFRVIDLKLSVFLRAIFRSSLISWEELVDRHTTLRAAAVTLPPGAVDAPEKKSKKNPLNKKGVEDVIENDLVSQTNGLISASSLYPTLSLQCTEEVFPLQMTNPLFQLQISISEGKIFLEPSVEDIQGAFIHGIEKMVSSMRSITSVDKEAMSLLTLEARVIMNIGVGDPLYGDLDSLVKQLKVRINSKVVAAMKGPLKLCRMYNEFSWLMEEDVEDYLENFMASDPSPTLPDYHKELVRLDLAGKRIRSLSFHHESFDLVRLDTGSARSILLNRVEELHDGLGNLLAGEARQQNLDIVQRYTEILQRIAVKPTSERQLADLRDFIEESRKTVAELKESVKANKLSVQLLEDFNYLMSSEDMWLSWSTLEYPSKVEASGREVEIALEADKIRMMDKLSLQKEQFEKVVENLGNEVKAARFLDDYGDKEKIVERVNSLMDNIAEAKLKGDDFNMRERVFGFIPTEYSILEKFAEDLGPFYKLWNMVSDFHNSRNDWLNGDFKELDGTKIDEDVTDWWKTSYKLAKSLEDEYPGAAACAAQLRGDTTEFRKHLPCIQSLASKALQPWHWDLVSDLLGKPIDIDDLSLQALLDLDAAGHIEAIQEVTTAAEKEYNLKRNLEGMLKEWDSMEFEVKAYKESGTFVVGGIDDIIAMLDDHIVKTQTMRGSPYIKRNENECKAFEYRLKYAQSFLDELIACQRTWMYLEPIFCSEDIIRQLPTEARRFSGVDALWRKTLLETFSDPTFWTQADPEKRLEEKFKKANEKLEEITKGLNDYLEMKRLYFPRFFFLSNDELLEILSQTKEPRAVQPHLGKCFEGINKVKFETDLKITDLISAEGEVVRMDRPVDPENPGNKGNVERWLLEIESIQWDSIRSLTVQSIEQYTKIARKEWILNWPAQIILGVSCVFWTAEVTKALSVGGGKSLYDCNTRLDIQLREMVELVRGPLSKLQRKTLGALTTIDVHNRDVVSKMVDLGTSDGSDFQWMSQLRYYWEDAWKDGQAVKRGMKTLVARIVNARCLYGYEYLGNTMRLVITALTDRCYRTMIGAVDLLYGGAPEGPAGTGKTETVKDLSKAVAIHCVVFNCSDGLDYLAMAKFFKGLAGCGSWCCFDEFNRINIEVLSVIAQQILVINEGKRQNKEMFQFEGTYMKLNSNCNVFITMNPGYAGRAGLYLSSS